MVLTRQILRNLYKTKSQFLPRSGTALITRQDNVQLKQVYTPCRRFYNSPRLLVKLFLEKENKYAYNVMEKSGYVQELIITKNIDLLTQEQFESILSQDWSKESPQEIFKVFSLITNYCSKNKICISNNIFDNFIDALTDNIQNSSDEELKNLFFSLAQCPETPSIRTRNYVEVWAALDDVCVNRFKSWPHDKMLLFASLFYMLSATKASDYCYKCIQKIIYKADRLTKSQIVQIFFYISAMRYSPHDMHSLELAVQQKFKEFTIDELAIISMGFFKSKVPIRNMEIISNIIDEVMDNVTVVNEVSLAALLKVIRLSRKFPIDNKIFTLLDVLQYEVPRLSLMCNVHIALLATSTLTFHKNCLDEITNKMLQDLSQARLKDIERIILALGTFNYMPKNKENFIDKIIDELKKSEREQEYLTHGRSFACCVSYLGLLGIYPIDLYKRVLNKQFLESTYGKGCHSYGREIFTIHNLAKIFHKDIKLECVTDKEVLTLAKKYTDYIPDVNFNKQYNVTERMFLDVQKVIEDTRGGPEFLAGHHIVPHHQRGDLIICDQKDGTPIPVQDTFKKIKFGPLCYVPDENDWIVVIIAGRNAIIYNSDIPSGHILSKIKELNALGFLAAPVCWNKYTKCKTFEEKRNYITKVIAEAKSKSIC